ncbi:CRISPR-associated endonuclease Cas2 [Sedimenticola thiotaurini]|uniref:CRISPR-associated endoribonuclease Cas2 n=1 Tax=Sedimenticola thiotaurini TaxID=1543721 RepID=A0A0F7K0U2_9GAMM|nr:CRISPR-associated endonuclease Cas2 [Sedimenticola thiotaurini]AKH21522.1 CRISPR-associated protein Cas2 [Sedimenticola thiotaurini]
MSQETRRFMRLLVFFDLPTITREDKRAYTLFRRFLLKDGYDMIQWSVYGRVINGFDNMETHLKRLSANLPPEGSVRCLQVSEKQFVQMKLLVGEPKKQEKTVSSAQLVLL